MIREYPVSWVHYLRITVYEQSAAGHIRIITMNLSPVLQMEASYVVLFLVEFYDYTHL